MRRFASLLMVALLALGLMAGGCGDKKKDEGKTNGGTTAVSMSAQEIIDKAMAASPEIKSSSGKMDMKLTVDMGASASADPSTAMFSQGPISITGDFAAQNEPMAADMNMSVGLAGNAMAMGVKIVDNEMYINYLGTWYKAPPEMSKSLQTQQTQAQGADPMAQLKAMGIDPTTWATEMTVVGTETVAGAECYHVKIGVDTAKMIADLFKVMNSPEVQKALGEQQTQQIEQISGLSASDMEQIKQIFKSASLELWVQTDNFFTRQTKIAGELVPPPDEAAGVNSMSLEATITIDTVNEPVTVQAPPDAKPWKDLSGALGGLGGTTGL